MNTKGQYALMKHNILVADDDEGIRSALTMLLKSEGFVPTTVDSPESALEALRYGDFSLVLMDLNFSLDTTSGDEGLQLVASIRRVDELIPIVVMTGWGTIEVAVSTMQKGANDFIQKPWENDRLLSIINNQIALAKSQIQTQKLSEQYHLLQEEAHPHKEIVAQSPAIQRVLQTLKQVAASDVSVLLTGENGTGKSMYARYLHDLSSRHEQPMISVNMGAVTESLFESEMFGHVKGAFTDAKSTRIGRFELADQGTLFLDEIANTPYSQQGKLLRVLEESQFEKVGSSKTQTVDVRLITATNSDLNEAVEQGQFRKDLLYRINTIELEIPALRNRKEDILPLANSFLAQIAKKYSQPVKQIDKSAEPALLNYDWPGNVRELNHIMERAHILCHSETILPQDLGINVELDSFPVSAGLVDDDLRPIHEIEQDIIDKRLNYFDGEASKAAKSLGMSRSALYRRLGKSKE
ncbi:sigma-54-dependent transcriptional regulator [Paraneptunicella aestuarii]|uniref:sigma-54-dependent transcriptional regulator n=1 Tax=Paraneptunicella aestuarii TaxID=2831148 RepID=UPI0022B6A522|nr:sigma-54 dependent transcriptional regulator [Paraneptunicella aestuarii]